MKFWKGKQEGRLLLTKVEKNICMKILLRFYHGRKLTEEKESHKEAALAVTPINQRRGHTKIGIRIGVKFPCQSEKNLFHQSTTDARVYNRECFLFYSL